MPKIAVLGPGGVGGFVAAALARASEKVILVAREPTAHLIAQHGITVNSTALNSDFTARPQAQAALTEPVEVLVVATKAGGLVPALERIQVEPGLVVPLLNGLEHMALLRDRFGAQGVIAGVIRIESDRPEPGQIVQSSPSVRIDLASDDPALNERLRSAAVMFEAASIPVHIGTSEAEVLWSKLARLNALSLTTSASDRPIGFVRTDPRWRSALEAAVNETVAVANADGATLNAAATLDELDQAHAELGSSMRRDIAAGREPELDALAGAVLRAAGRHGLACPTVSWLAGQVARRAAMFS
jgi:2-dehydropantoate 2-reductase